MHLYQSTFLYSQRDNNVLCYIDYISAFVVPFFKKKITSAIRFIDLQFLYESAQNGSALPNLILICFFDILKPSLSYNGMAEPEVSRRVAINEALIDLSRTVNEQYALRLTLQTGMASNEHMVLVRIYDEITSFEQRHRARVSFYRNVSAPGVNHRFLPIEVAEYMESLARVDIDSLGTEEEEDSKCDICQESFGRPRDGRTPPPSSSPRTITPSSTTTTSLSSSSSSSLSLTSLSTQQHNINGSESECECESGQPVEAANPMNSEMGEDEQPENAVRLECGHIFGERCIRRWINEGNPPTCPTCRRVLNGSERGEGDALTLQVEYLWNHI